MNYHFKREPMVETVLIEGAHLAEKHYKEVAHYPDIPMEPDHDAYNALEDNDNLRCFTARTDDGTLVGYSVYFLRYNMHYKSSFQAVQDIIFVDPDHRGFGAKFIKWCDNELKEIGVQVVYHHVKKKLNFGPMLERQGYELIDLIYGKRLD